MSFEIDKALVKSYHANVELKFQQKGSRLRQYVREESQNAEFDFWDRIGPTEAVKVENRHSDTPLISSPHDRRRNAIEDYDWADLIDRKDRLRMLADPTSPYTLNAVYAIGRKMDKAILDAALGTAYTGKDGANSVVFPTGTQQVSVSYNEDGSTTAQNLTVGKLRRVRTMFDLEEAADDEEEGTIVMAVTAHQIQSLLRTTEVTSSDYNTVKALVNGAIDQFMGIKFVRISPKLMKKSGNNRSCIAFSRNGIMLGVADDIMVDVGPRRDKRNSVQVYVCASFGAVRMWEERVVEVLCDETK